MDQEFFSLVTVGLDEEGEDYYTVIGQQDERNIGEVPY